MEKILGQARGEQVSQGAEAANERAGSPVT